MAVYHDRGGQVLPETPLSHYVDQAMPFALPYPQPIPLFLRSARWYRWAMRVFAIVLGFTLCACKPASPAGTSVVDWTYTPTTKSDSVPTPLSPPKTVIQSSTWPLANGPPLALRFETELGEQTAAGMRWRSPRHVRVSLAQPTSAPLPMVNCMPAPPGNKVQDGRLVPPVGHDGTPIGRVGCFFASKTDHYVFDIDGDGQVTGSVPGRP